jgi:hypothetical protein
MSVRPHPPDQRGTVLLSCVTLRKLTTESSTSRFALVTLTLAVTGIGALGFGGWLASVAVLSPVESLLMGSALPGFGGFFLLFVGVFGSLGVFMGGLIAFQSTLCLLWHRARPHTERGPSRDVVHERRGSDPEEDESHV